MIIITSLFCIIKRYTLKISLKKKNIFFLQSSLTPDYNYEESIKRTEYVRVALSKNA